MKQNVIFNFFQEMPNFVQYLLIFILALLIGILIGKMIKKECAGTLWKITDAYGKNYYYVEMHKNHPPEKIHKGQKLLFYVKTRELY